MADLDSSAAKAPPRRIRPRAPKLDYADVPRHWLRGDPVATQIANGVNLLFPAGERFFIRSVKHYMSRIDDPVLLEQVRGFFAQEGRHAVAHEKQFEYLEAQGYEIKEFLAGYERLAFGIVEPLAPPALRLAVTAAAEHYTAIMAKGGLSDVDALAGAHPQMRALLLWHASEEIEHKAVAFDVLSHVAPSYALRVTGMAVATLCLATGWTTATAMLLRQDRRAGRPTKPTARARHGDRSILRDVFLRGIASYLRPGFHPLDDDDVHLAETYLATAGVA